MTKVIYLMMALILYLTILGVLVYPYAGEENMLHYAAALNAWIIQPSFLVITFMTLYLERNKL